MEVPRKAVRHLEPISIDVVRVPLTQGYYALIDEADALEVGRFNWYALKVRDGKVYAARGDYSGPTRRTIYMHREIAASDCEQQTDHRNGDTLDNRRSNLRGCTPLQNSQNRTTVLAASGFKGVQQVGNRWMAYIGVKTQRHYLGLFKTPEEAARIYDAAALKYFGEFARTNESLGRL